MNPFDKESTPQPDEAAGTRLLDLTLPSQLSRDGEATVETEEWGLGEGEGAYTAVVHRFRYDSMLGTYLDLPAHIRQTDDGVDAAGYSVDKLYRLNAAVVHLDRAGGSGAVSAAELAAACPKPSASQALVINALGRRRFDDIEERSVFLSLDAVEWIASLGVHLLVSDVYESREGLGVFLELFRRGISAVCYPVDLHLLTMPQIRLTVLPLPFPTATQLPCRVVAEMA